ncbi:hypothetical protein ACQ1PF_09610 [Ornithobacterium rhinotracheale]
MKGEIWQNINLLFSSIVATAFGFFSQRPLYDKDFDNQFKNEKEKREFYEKVMKLKDKGDSTPQEIELRNGTKFKVIVK